MLFSIYVIIIILFSHIAQASSLAGAVKGLQIDKINSGNEIKAALTLIKSCINEAEKTDALSFDLQKRILAKSGEITSRMVALQIPGRAFDGRPREELRVLFLQNRDALKRILKRNQKQIEYLQEHELDTLEDTTSFFTSPSWQEPQYLISLASYWLSWNGYYAALLYDEDDPFRAKILNKSVEGFSRSYIDFKEEQIVMRSLFGRAVCYRELKKYDKSLQDITSVLGKIKRGDSLYIRSIYEYILITHLNGQHESALKELKNTLEDIDADKISPDMHIGFTRLRIKIIRDLSEQQKGKGKNTSLSHYREIIRELNHMAAQDKHMSEELYHFANEQADILVQLSSSELGPLATLAVADREFEKQHYHKAAIRYRQLTRFTSPLLAEYLDRVFFRLAYCLCKDEQWEDALQYFQSLFTRFPRSSFTCKASCLNYVAATRVYKENPANTMYKRYIDAIKKYLQHCPEPQDASEARFQMGKYYQNRGNEKKAAKIFSKVNKDSPNYAQACYYVLKSSVDKLESLDARGLHQSKAAENLYRKACKQLEQYRSLVADLKNHNEKKELEAHIKIIQAKLYLYGPEKDSLKALDTLKWFQTSYLLKHKNKKLDVTAKHLRIICYQRTHMIDEAREEIQKFINNGPITGQGWTFLHDCSNNFFHESLRLYYTGDIITAARFAELCLTIYDHLLPIAESKEKYYKYSSTIRLRIGEIYRYKNRLEEARTIYLEELKRDPLSADAMYGLGLTNEKMKRWEEALETWRNFSRGLEPGSYYWFESRYRTAHVLDMLGNTEDACNIITMTHVLHPDLRDKDFKERFMNLKTKICENADQ